MNENDWILAKDKLPEKYQECLIFLTYDKNGKDIQTGYLDNNNEWNATHSVYVTEKFNENYVSITHWAYLTPYTLDINYE